MVTDNQSGNQERVEVPKNSGLYVRFKNSEDIDGRMIRESENINSSEYFDDGADYGVSTSEKIILCKLLSPSPKLPYPLKKLDMWQGLPALEYVIPEEARAEILEKLYPFVPCPGLDEIKYDIHADKQFRVREYRVIRELCRNMLVSPYYPESGGMVVDWMEIDGTDSCLRKCK